MKNNEYLQINEKKYFDLDDFLIRLDGNCALAKQLLQKYTGDHQAKLLLTLTRSGKINEAKALTHSLKGEAGNLSLKDFYQKLTILEHSYLAGKNDNEKALHDVILSAEVTRKAIERFLTT